MQTFVMSTRLAPGAFASRRSLAELDSEVTGPIDAECASVEWVGSYAIPGCDAYVAFFRAPDFASAARVSAILRTAGHARAELCTAAEWDPFLMR